jgi:hypothetical protein
VDDDDESLEMRIVANSSAAAEGRIQTFPVPYDPSASRTAYFPHPTVSQTKMYRYVRHFRCKIAYTLSARQETVSKSKAPLLHVIFSENILFFPL